MCHRAAAPGSEQSAADATGGAQSVCAFVATSNGVVVGRSDCDNNIRGSVTTACLMKISACVQHIL